MRVVPLDEVRALFSLKLRAAPKPAKRHLHMDTVYEKLVLEGLMSVLAGYVVVAPDMVGFNTAMRRGQFGVDEPWPAGIAPPPE